MNAWEWKILKMGLRFAVHRDETKMKKKLIENEASINIFSLQKRYIEKKF